MLDKNRLIFKYLFKLSIQNLLSISIIIIIVSSILHINSSVLFLLNSINNIIYIYLYGNKFPSYLIPNIIFISPILYLFKFHKYEYILSGFFFYGLIFLILSFIIKKYDFLWLNYFFPPTIIGLLIIVMSLDSSIFLIKEIDTNNLKSFSVFLFTFLTTILSSIFWNKFIFIPTFIGLISGCILSLYLNLVDLTKLYNVPWLNFPKIYFLQFNWKIPLIIFPLIFLSLIEYISFIIITEKNCFKKTKNNKNTLFKSILINSTLNMLLTFFGSIPSIFNNESIKLIPIKKKLDKKNINSNLIIYITSLILILLSFIGKVQMLIELIPIQVIIGISLLIYGTILFSGIKILCFNINWNNFKDILLIFITIIFGISGFKITYRNIEIKGLILSIILSLILNLLFKFINYVKFKFN